MDRETVGLMFGVGALYGAPNDYQQEAVGASHLVPPSACQNQLGSVTGDMIAKKSLFVSSLHALK